MKPALSKFIRFYMITDTPADVRHWQKHLIGRCAGSIERLERGLEPWSESDLDRYRLPHPLLGRLTVREMLLFTLYHYEHHKANVVRRMGSSEGPPKNPRTAGRA